MIHRSCPNHIHVYVHQAFCKVMICAYGGSEIAIFPKSALAIFPTVKLLGKSTGYQLHTSRNGPGLVLFDQKMNVIGCDDVVEDRQVVTLFRFEK